MGSELTKFANCIANVSVTSEIRSEMDQDAPIPWLNFGEINVQRPCGCAQAHH